MRKYKVIVQNKEHSIALAQYISRNITRINAVGIRIRMEKIDNRDLDDDMVEMLRKKGVTRLPALITDTGSIVVGKDKIIDLFDSCIRNKQRQAKISNVGGGEYGSNEEMAGYWSRELYSADESGRAVPRKDEEDNENDDLDTKIKQHRQRSAPKHRGSGSSIPASADEDNVGEPSSAGVMGDDAMDQMMLDAWMSNN